jgi:hypothetical protein
VFEVCLRSRVGRLRWLVKLDECVFPLLQPDISTSSTPFSIVGAGASSSTVFVSSSADTDTDSAGVGAGASTSDMGVGVGVFSIGATSSTSTSAWADDVASLESIKSLTAINAFRSNFEKLLPAILLAEPWAIKAITSGEASAYSTTNRKISTANFRNTKRRHDTWTYN